jgi:hypothetical protein
MASTVGPGKVLPRVRHLIVVGCIVTVAIASMGMQAMWEAVESVQVSSAGAHGWGFGRSAFWYQNGLALGLAVALVLIAKPRFDVSRLLRVAVLLPIAHALAIVVAGVAWSVLRGDLEIAHRAWGFSTQVPKIALPSAVLLVVAFAALLAIAVAIKRRHGEWAHAAVMLALANLLLVGLWVPVLARLSVSEPGPMEAIEMYDPFWGWDWLYNRRLLSRGAFEALAIIPPAIAALAFTTIAFRSPRWFTRVRAWSPLGVKLLLGGAVLSTLTMPDESWLLYLESSYLVMFAMVFAIGALVTLTIITRLGSLASHFSFSRLPKLRGTIASDETDEVARYEVTSWLRGPRLVTRPFVVATPTGNVPLDGVTVLAPVPASTTALDIGGHAPVLAAGDSIVIGGRKTKTGADPFRTIDATEVAAVAAPDARPYRFSDVTLVVWRPAVAYLAILIAVALPYLSIVIT